jgi:hypothetical protein
MCTHSVTAFVLVMAATCVAAAGEPANLREVDRLIFEGQEAFQTRDLCDVLRGDFDVARAAHPRTDLPQYLRAIQRTLLTAYQHSGFGAASVAAAYDESREKIVVRVKEGPRHRCGDIRITGCQSETSRALLQCLTIAEDPSAILWQKGQAAPFDEVTAAEIRRRLEETLCQAGLLDAKY